MQLFALSPFITLLFWHYGVVSLGLVTLLTVACVVFNTLYVQNRRVEVCTGHPCVRLHVLVEMLRLVFESLQASAQARNPGPNPIPQC